MQIRKALLAGLIAALVTPLAFACGPEFPPQLLSDRAATLLDLPEGTFDFEATHLVPKPATAFPLVERADWIWINPPPPTQVDIERGWLGDAYERVALMRVQDNAAAAWAKGVELPPEARLYTTGAVAFAKAEYDEAIARFRAVLALPPDQRTHYGVPAQYMLARTALEREDVDRAAARAAYRATRELVAAGAIDPLGLAATSFGDEAWIELHDGNDAGAIALYAQQAALGSAFGRTSLLFVAREIVRDGARLQRAVADPLSQRLLVAYLYSRADELQADAEGADENGHGGNVDASAAPKAIAAFLAAVEKQGVEKLEGADRLAALAYRQGNYALAQKLAEKSDAALAQWVRAKLALRDGDVARAAQAYAAASKGFPQDERWEAPGSTAEYVYGALEPACRVEGERGALALSRGEYVVALEHLYSAAKVYWNDAAYVAERVLSVDELKSFVDAKVPAVPTAKPAEGSWQALPPAMQLRALLARRLLRVGRYDDALRYFDDAALKAKAQSYADARRAAEHGGRIERAQAAYQAAVLARQDGMDLIGFELDPDYQIYGGSYDFNWQDGEDVVDGKLPPRPDIHVPPKWNGADEAQRVAASVAAPLRRFHYRFVAADLAAQAADLLPTRSQAFAATLCAATGYVLNDDQTLGEKYWRRYVKQGPYVPWAANFGLQCAEPDFVGAAQRLRAERIAAAKRFVRHNAPWIAGGLVLLGAGLFWQWRRRKARKSVA